MKLFLQISDQTFIFSYFFSPIPKSSINPPSSVFKRAFLCLLQCSGVQLLMFWPDATDTCVYVQGWFVPKKKKRKKSDASALAPEYMIPSAIYSDWVKLTASQITPFIACTCLYVSSVCVYNPFCSLCSRNRISKSKFRLVHVVSQSLFHSPAVGFFFFNSVCVCCCFVWRCPLEPAPQSVFFYRPLLK